MSYFNRHKWWLIAIVILLIINTATLAIFWMERKGEGLLLGSHPKQANAQAFLIKELSLDSAQQAQYLLLIKAHREGSNTIKNELKDAKDAFFKLLSDSTATDAMIKQAADKASAIETQLDVLTFNHFKQVRNICTPQQKIKFNQIIENVVKMMGPNQQQRPQRPPRDNQSGDRRVGPPDDGQGPPPPNDDHRPPPDGQEPPPPRD